MDKLAKGNGDALAALGADAELLKTLREANALLEQVRVRRACQCLCVCVHVRVASMHMYSR